jgi:hypothetical protein
MDDQDGQRTITAGMEGSDGSGNAQSRQTRLHRAPQPWRGWQARHGSLWPHTVRVDGNGNAGTVGMASGGLALYRMAGKA